MRKSIRFDRPRKPRPDFPLFPHQTRRWAKKVHGRLAYFGSIAGDPKGEAALNRWLDEKDDLLAGRVPRSRRTTDAPTLRDLCNQFLTTKRHLVDTHELSIYSFNDYHRVCAELIEHFGRDRLLTDLLPEDWETLRVKWAKTWGPVRLGNEINRARVVMNYAYKNGLLDKPMRYGEGFKRPSKKTLRQARAEKGPRMFDAQELRRVISAARQPLKTMILLGINSGLGNTDVALLPMKALNLDNGWLDYPRPKTGTLRRCPLWPETVAAVRDWLTQRPFPKAPTDEPLVFLSRTGRTWVRESSDNPVSTETRKLLRKLGINGTRNFYALRHTFETVAGESRDQVAVDAIMGHVDSSMAGEYRECISDERLVAVTNHVHTWLFGE
jgi:integrase